MDPITITSLVSGCVGVADVTLRLGSGLRHLQVRFNEALDHVDTIVNQTHAVDLALREICSLLRDSPQTFPSSFPTRLQDVVDAINVVVGHVQEHARLVQAEADESPRRAKLLHVRSATKVEQWEKTLGAQIQVLSLLLHVASLRTSGERMSVLEQDSSHRLFERASSMSAKIGVSSPTSSIRQHGSTDESITRFIFDPIVLQSKVYRRHCESAFIREVTTSSLDIADSHPSPAPSSVSTNDAIGGQSDASIQVNSGGSTNNSGPISNGFVPGETSASRAAEATETETEEHCQTSRSGLLPPVLSEDSTAGTTQTDTVDSNTTESTLATTLSSYSQSHIAGKMGDNGNKSIMAVTVEGVGNSQVELPARQPDYYKVVLETVVRLRDSLLASKGITAAESTYTMTNSGIEASGERTDHFPFTDTFLRAALEVLDGGTYSHININATFSPPSAQDHKACIAGVVTSQACESPRMQKSARASGITVDHPLHHTNLMVWKAARASSAAPHYFCRVGDASPFYEKSQSRKGGFGEVFKASLHQQYHLAPIDNDRQLPAKFAVKKLTKATKEQFEREADILRRLGSAHHPHIIKLLATFSHQSDYYFVFPWAEYNLREFWKHTTIWQNQSLSSSAYAIWMTNQCAGLADSLDIIHGEWANGFQSRGRERSGRHGDLKPGNILWFRESNTSDSADSGLGHLVISDFGLGRLQSTSFKLVNDSAAKIPCTPTYRAPEYDLPPRSKPLSSTYDIWSLGCVLLEFITWFLDGHEGTERFNKEKRLTARDGASFIKDGSGQFALNPAVSAHLGKVESKLSKLDPPIRKGLTSFLTLAASCLEVDEDKRPSAATLAEQFKKLSTVMGKSMELKKGEMQHNR
ncbi:kinase-like domain-containing protein [Podospora didyma]|uniref:Kinase-like domain-containing protein n=1 Tax=Podospora didyma TaxID=330526 RepID=A0AAE0NHY0_9PEZI|nr:kinase-like domain-containing protein [Podospora didyma]